MAQFLQAINSANRNARYFANQKLFLLLNLIHANAKSGAADELESFVVRMAMRQADDQDARAEQPKIYAYICLGAVMCDSADVKLFIFRMKRQTEINK